MLGALLKTAVNLGVATFWAPLTFGLSYVPAVIKSADEIRSAGPRARSKKIASKHKKMYQRTGYLVRECYCETCALGRSSRGLISPTVRGFWSSRS
jgi:hypothetical protein